MSQQQFDIMQEALNHLQRAALHGNSKVSNNEHIKKAVQTLLDYVQGPESQPATFLEGLKAVDAQVWDLNKSIRKLKAHEASEAELKEAGDIMRKVEMTLGQPEDRDIPSVSSVFSRWESTRRIFKRRAEFLKGSPKA